MTLEEEMKEFGIRPIAYSMEGSSIRIEDRGAGAWAITNGGSCLNRDYQWEHEPLPSSRTQEFFERCRFGKSEAIHRAIEAKKRNL